MNPFPKNRNTRQNRRFGIDCLIDVLGDDISVFTTDEIRTVKTATKRERKLGCDQTK